MCSTYIIQYLKGELHYNYIFLHFASIGLEWDYITLFTKMNFFFLPKLTFQHHLHKIYIHISISISFYLSIYLSIYLSMYLSIYIYIHISIYIYIYICIYIYNIYIYICVYMAFYLLTWTYFNVVMGVETF